MFENRSPYLYVCVCVSYTFFCRFNKKNIKSQPLSKKQLHPRLYPDIFSKENSTHGGLNASICWAPKMLMTVSSSISPQVHQVARPRHKAHSPEGMRHQYGHEKKHQIGGTPDVTISSTLKWIFCHSPFTRLNEKPYRLTRPLKDERITQNWLVFLGLCIFPGV